MRPNLILVSHDTARRAAAYTLRSARTDPDRRIRQIARHTVRDLATAMHRAPRTVTVPAEQWDDYTDALRRALNRAGAETVEELLPLLQEMTAIGNESARREPVERSPRAARQQDNPERHALRAHRRRQFLTAAACALLIAGGILCSLLGG